jgi:hypothetical protein
MTDERWETLVARLMDRFPGTRFHKFDEKNDYGVDEKHEVLSFCGLDGKKFELERITRPRIEERHVNYSKRRPGSQESVVFSQTEFVNFVKLYRLDGDNWNEVDMDAIAA